MEAVKVQHNTPEWLAFRKNGIGGSEASAILGLNPYLDNVTLWEIKTGIKAKADISSNAAIEYGHAAEGLLTDLFALDFPEYEVIDCKDEVYTNDCMFASLDGKLIEKATGRLGVLEVKTAEIFASMAKEKWNDRIPDNYFVQVLHYMSVMDAEFAVLKAQLKSRANDGSLRITTRHYHIERSEVVDDIKYLEAEERKFWTEYVLKKVRPPRQLGFL